jgi:hypothetical protein
VSSLRCQPQFYGKWAQLGMAVVVALQDILVIWYMVHVAIRKINAARGPKIVAPGGMCNSSTMTNDPKVADA